MMAKGKWKRNHNNVSFSYYSSGKYFYSTYGREPRAITVIWQDPEFTPYSTYWHDYDELATLPSQDFGTAQNNCEHLHIEGSLHEEPYFNLDRNSRWLSPEGRTLINPVVIACPGRTVKTVTAGTTYVKGKNRPARTEWDFQMNAPTTIGRQRIYSGKLTSVSEWQDDDGTWKKESGSTSNLSKRFYIQPWADSSSVTLRRGPATPPLVGYIVPHQGMWEHIDQFCDEQATFGDLVIPAAKSIRKLNNNMTAYIRDTLRGGELLTLNANALEKITDLIKKAPSPTAMEGWLKHNLLSDPTTADYWDELVRSKESLKGVMKDLANLYLGNHYGTRLQVADTAKIIDAANTDTTSAVDVAEKLAKYDGTVYLENASHQLKEDAKRARHYYQRIGATHDYSEPSYGKYTDLAYTRRLFAVIDEFDSNEMHVCNTVSESTEHLVNDYKRAFYEADLLPSWDNLWDLVPYSFVADWFLPIQRQLEQSEIAGYARTFNVRKVFESTEANFTQQVNMKRGASVWRGTLNYRWYKRFCFRSLPIPSMRLDEPPKAGFTHSVEAAALLIQAL